MPRTANAFAPDRHPRLLALALSKRCAARRHLSDGMAWGQMPPSVQRCIPSHAIITARL